MIPYFTVYTDFQYEYAMDADIRYRDSDPYDGSAKETPCSEKGKKLSILPCNEIPR